MFAVWLSKVLRTPGVISLVLMLCVACIQQPTPGTKSRPPIKVGISLSFSGGFAEHGKAIERGYQLWADTVNKHGGLLGRRVQLIIIPDDSSQEQVVTNYLKLIKDDQVDLVFGPTSTPQVIPASVVANYYRYAMPEGSGGGPSIFDRGLHNVFDVSLSDASKLVSFIQYILSLPLAARPKTAAYLFNDDFVTMPQVTHASLLLQQGGIHTVYNFIYPVETTTYAPLADKVVSSGAQLVVLGTRFPDVVAFVQTFRQRHYNPQALIATAGPDQSDNFIKAIGSQSAEGVLVPRGWYPEANTYQNADMVKAYLAKYGGKTDDISPDIAEAYSVGQVVEQAINKIYNLNNAALIHELHTDTFNTVQGTARFDNSGQNVAAQAYLLQWQRGVLIAVYPPLTAVAHPEFPKPQWP